MATTISATASGAADTIDRTAIEPRLLWLLNDKHERRKAGVYIPRTAEEIAAGLTGLFAQLGIAASAHNVKRMGGGASKEQFVFDVTGDIPAQFRRCVLRMDPREGIIETCRRREGQILRAVYDTVPVPPVLCVDDGGAMGQPFMITGFVGGVAKPSASGAGPSGLGGVMPEALAKALTPQFIAHLAAVHAVELSGAGLDDYAVPRPGTTDAALWQVNYWTKVREMDGTDSLPLLTLAETWLYDHLPVCDDPVLLHGDHRLGNFLFDEQTMQITAVLDWELAHIGDFHEDIAYSFEPLFGQRGADGRLIVGSMVPTDEFVAQYQTLTGRVIDLAKLHWYQVLTSYKLMMMNHTSSIIAARDGTNHQNALLAWLAAVTAGLSATMVELLAGEFA
jgi:aminoglycoside phosphotransferase (APT) family kinase protein